MEYHPFGTTYIDEGTADTNYRYTGKELDASTGLYFYGARYYDAKLGRFITPDTIVQAPLDPQTLNRYSYCRNNPLKYTDPTGQFFGFIAAIVAIVKAVVSFAIAHPIIAGAVIGATTGGISAATGGGNVVQGILTGGTLGAITGCGFATGKLAAIAFTGAISGGAQAALGGYDPGGGMLIGTAVGVLSFGVAKLPVPSTPFWSVAQEFTTSTGLHALQGGAIAEVSGGKFSEGAERGAKYGAIVSSVKMALLGYRFDPHKATTTEGSNVSGFEQKITQTKQAASELGLDLSKASEITVYRRGGWLFRNGTGLTWGYNVSVASDAAADAKSFAKLLTHETTHVAQQTQTYGVAEFYVRYASDMPQYGVSREHPLEQGPYEIADPYN